jgi:hypothetical protein
MNLKTAFRWVTAAPVYCRAGAGTVARIGPFGQEALRAHMALGAATLLVAAIQATAAVPLRSQCANTRRVGVADGKWRCADRLVRPTGGDRRRDRYSSGPKGDDRLEYFRTRRPRHGDHVGVHHLARLAPVDRSGCAEHRDRRGCADPGFRGARFDPAARAVAAPADPTMRGLISLLSFDLDADNSRRMEGWSNGR